MTGDCYLEFGFQVSDDPENWPAGHTFTRVNITSATADGLFSNSGFEDISSGLTKAHVRFSFLIRNYNNGSPKIESVWVSARFDTRSC